MVSLFKAVLEVMDVEVRASLTELHRLALSLTWRPAFDSHGVVLISTMCCQIEGYLTL